MTNLTSSTQASQLPLRDTVLSRFLPLLPGPVSTVSKGFCNEALLDALQTEHFAPHLQRILRRVGIVPTPNGVFGKLVPPFSSKAVTEARNGNSELILREKEIKRRAMLRVISDYRDSRILGRLDGGGGRPLLELPDHIPVLMAFGRMDPSQKGMDKVARVIEWFPRGIARFVLAPDVGSGAGAFLADLARVAEWFPGEVIVFPFRMQSGYSEIMGGSSYVVMSSFYEPFGAASEGYLAGSPVVARRTGGLPEQVDDIEDPSGEPTGILFRETLPAQVPAGENWKRLLAFNEPDLRMTVPLYRAMTFALCDALHRAKQIYCDKRDTLYARMLANVFHKAESLSWTKSVNDYQALYEGAMA
jgi:glycosyltransferase involved in cell wall biosynthesis